MPNSKALDRLLKGGATDDHSLVEIDGTYCKPTAEAILTGFIAGAIIRIGKHLYMDRRPLTIDAPGWSLLFPEQDQ